MIEKPNEQPINDESRRSFLKFIGVLVVEFSFPGLRLPISHAPAKSPGSIEVKEPTNEIIKLFNSLTIEQKRLVLTGYPIDLFRPDLRGVTYSDGRINIHSLTENFPLNLIDNPMLNSEADDQKEEANTCACHDQQKLAQLLQLQQEEFNPPIQYYYVEIPGLGKFKMSGEPDAHPTAGKVLNLPIFLRGKSQNHEISRRDYIDALRRHEVATEKLNDLLRANGINHFTLLNGKPIQVNLDHELRGSNLTLIDYTERREEAVNKILSKLGISIDSESRNAPNIFEKIAILQKCLAVIINQNGDIIDGVNLSWIFPDEYSGFPAFALLGSCETFVKISSSDGTNAHELMHSIWALLDTYRGLNCGNRDGFFGVQHTCPADQRDIMNGMLFHFSRNTVHKIEGNNGFEPRRRGFIKHEVKNFRINPDGLVTVLINKSTANDPKNDFYLLARDTENPMRIRLVGIDPDGNTIPLSPIILIFDEESSINFPKIPYNFYGTVAVLSEYGVYTPIAQRALNSFNSGEETQVNLSPKNKVNNQFEISVPAGYTNGSYQIFSLGNDQTPFLHDPRYLDPSAMNSFGSALSLSETELPIDGDYILVIFKPNFPIKTIKIKYNSSTSVHLPLVSS